MPRPLLVIGNKNYSSWSLRPWIAMRVLKLDFQEVRIPLYGPGARQEILRYSPSGKVPCLVDGASRVWDSLAILEYLAEKHPLWPDDPVERAVARSVCAEMHAGFPKLREHMSMNVRKRYPGRGRTPEVLEEIERVVEICRSAGTRSCSERSALQTRCTRRWCCASGRTRSSCRRRAAPTPMPCSPCLRCASGSKRRSARPRSFRSSTWPSEDVRRRRGGARRIAGPASEGPGSCRRRRDA